MRLAGMTAAGANATEHVISTLNNVGPLRLRGSCLTLAFVVLTQV